MDQLTALVSIGKLLPDMPIYNMTIATDKVRRKDEWALRVTIFFKRPNATLVPRNYWYFPERNPLHCEQWEAQRIPL